MYFTNSVSIPVFFPSFESFTAEFVKKTKQKTQSSKQVSVCYQPLHSLHATVCIKLGVF